MVTNDNVSVAPTRHLKRKPVMWLQSSRDGGSFSRSPVVAEVVRGTMTRLVGGGRHVTLFVCVHSMCGAAREAP